ncbi:MAG TPA: SRPBCC domain-containing protein [Candidatus Limnocylindrales bacterium]|nr:SRPBCC domain-containing protein [Candidatus Limnocylindrales bacterium]
MSPTRKAAAGAPAEARIEIADPVRTVHMTKRLDAPPYRVYRAWTSPEALSEWFPESVEGSLAPGTRSTLVFPEQRVWWEMLEAEPYSRVRFRWPWLPGDEWVTEVTVTIEPRGYGSMVTLEDGPFDLTVPGVLEAYAECLEGWGEALAHMRAVVDYSVDLRRYR